MKINYSETPRCFGSVFVGTIIKDEKGRISMKIQEIYTDFRTYNIVLLEKGELDSLNYMDNVTVYPDAELTL